MKKILVLLTAFSFSFAGTVYMAYDFDETENVTLGYNHVFKTYVCEETGKPSWILAGGVNYDAVADDVGFAGLYALPMKFVTEKMAVWATLGFSTVTEGDMDGGLTYGLGVHYYLNETCGVGLGMINHDWEMGDTEDTLEKMNLVLSYKF
tara:strand:+ start:167 stop:616 length:450 start_codon:yes stop_codon:yes gene_type:complete